MKKNYWFVVSIVAIAAVVLTACAPAGTSTGTQSPATTGTAASTTGSTPAATAAATTGSTPASTSAGTTPTAATTQSGGAGGTPGASTGSGNIDCMGAQKGDKLTMFYQWSGQEEARLNQILKPLVDACGINIQPTATRDQAVLETNVKSGTPPDVAFWQISTATQYKSQLVPLDTLGGHKENYDQSFINQGSVGGKWLGLPVKLDIKTIIWYSPAYFQAHNYTVPTTWDQLNTLVNKMVSDGSVPWSMGLESGAST